MMTINFSKKVRVKCKCCKQSGRASMQEEYDRGIYVCGTCGSVSDIRAPHKLIRRQHFYGKYVYSDKFKDSLLEWRPYND